MPSSGKKHKSKENTWSEKELAAALQGGKSRISKAESSGHRGSKESRSQKSYPGEGDHDEAGKDRQRSKHERSERHHRETTLDGEGSSSGRVNGAEDDPIRERRRSSSRDRAREKQRRERSTEDDANERRRDRRKDEASRREDDGTSRVKERSRRSKDDPDVDKERRRDSHGRHDKEKGDRRRERNDDRRKEGKKDDKERENEEEERRREKEHRRRSKENEERGRERDKRRRHKDEDDDRRHKDKDERRKARAKDEEHREKEDRRREKERLLEASAADERRSERRKEKERDRRRRHEEAEEDVDYEKERERRRRRQEEREAKENSRNTTETESREKDERRRERREKERSEEDKEEKRRRREDREKRKQKEYDEEIGKKERERRRDERRRTEYEDSVRKKSKEKLEANGGSSYFQNEAEIDEEIATEVNYAEDNYAEDNYEDDFEDYEDDFEDADEDEDEGVASEHEKGKLLEIFEAINAENDDVRGSPFQQTSREDPVKEEMETVHKPVKSSTEGRINFFTAKQRHVNDFVASKTKKRAEELRNLIELDVAAYDIFDLPPLNEYELYIKSYGQSDRKQAYVQCHDDIIEKEMQTEEIEMSTKWTQFPPDDFKGCGGEESVDKDSSAISSPHSVDSVKLSNFLQEAGQVCLILLEEKLTAKTNLMFKERNDIDISDGFIQLGTKLPFLEGRRVLDMNFNTIQTHLLLTAHDANTGSSRAASNDWLHGKGIICFWNVNEPTQPQKILVCESSPKSCCFSPIKSSLVFAGLDDGSIVIWDVREASALHSTVKYNEKHWLVRRPTFSTAGVFHSENHVSPVQNVLPISLPKESAQASTRASFVQDDLGGMAFQLASLDNNGVVNIWVVIELEKPDEAGSENDLGLAPGGRVKLIKSTSIQVQSPHREIFPTSSVQTSMMQFSKVDSNHFYVATDRGWVVHCTRYGGKTQPKAYRPEVESFVTVTTLDISPWSSPIMLVGCADGTLRLHDLRKEFVIRGWPESTQGHAIVQVKWSRSRPSLFYVLDTQSNLYIWDLLQSDSRPVSEEHFKRGKLLLFSISNDYESLGIGLPGRKSELVLNYEGGIIELHRLKQTLTNFEADELDKFSSLMDSFI